MRFQVDTESSVPLKLNETDPLASIMQSIRVILATRQGTIPHYRDFGLPQQFLDKPEPVARTMMAVEIREAIERFEPRVRFIGVSFRSDPVVPGRIIPTVEVEVIG